MQQITLDFCIHNYWLLVVCCGVVIIHTTGLIVSVNNRMLSCGYVDFVLDWEERAKKLIAFICDVDDTCTNLVFSQGVAINGGLIWAIHEKINIDQSE